MINIHGISHDIEYDIVHRFRKHEVTRLQWTNSTVVTGVGEPDPYFVYPTSRLNMETEVNTMSCACTLIKLT